jgi:membrane protein
MAVGAIAGSDAAAVRAGERESDAPQVEERKASTGIVAKLKDKWAATRLRLQRYAAFRVLESVVEGFRKDRVMENAAAMTYYGVFSLFPLILLFMSLAGLALQSSEAAREQIMGVVVGLLPQGQDELRRVIAGVIDAKGVAAGVGMLALLWGALGWFQVIDNNVNEIWGVSKPRSFLRGKLFALAMVVAIGFVALASFAATAAVHILEQLTGDIPGSVVLWQAVVSLLSVLTIAAVFFVLFRYAPQRDQSFRDVWLAAIITAVVWELTRRLLAFYLEQTNMISGYGPIGAAMALLFWIYVASIIILCGAELAYAIAKERRDIGADEEMEVVAAPGEQPTPKFAPQVGGGSSEQKDEREPIRAAAPAAAVAAAQGASATDAHGPVVALAGDSRVPAGAAASTGAAGPRRSQDIHLDLPLVAMLSLAAGFVAGRLDRSAKR